MATNEKKISVLSRECLIISWWYKNKMNQFIDFIKVLLCLMTTLIANNYKRWSTNYKWNVSFIICYNYIDILHV